MDAHPAPAESPKRRSRVIVIGASAGGIEALRELLAHLPADLHAPILVVVHIGLQAPSVLPQLLSRAGPLPVVSGRDGERLQTGMVYVAPPDRHLVVVDGSMRVTRGPKENGFRPAVDPLFRSAAMAYGPGAIGLILSGGLDDGTAGLAAIKERGGTALVQSPEEAQFPSMPLSALRHVVVDHVGRIADFPALLSRLASRPVEARTEPPADGAVSKVEVDIAMDDNAIESNVQSIGDPSPFACPECHGVLLMVKAAKPLRFRCHTGHAYSVESLVASLNDGAEAALWNAIRALEEGALLLDYVVEYAEMHRDSAADRERLRQRAQRSHELAKAVRDVVLRRENL